MEKLKYYIVITFKYCQISDMIKSNSEFYILFVFSLAIRNISNNLEYH
jgi:hypothetical protein